MIQRRITNHEGEAEAPTVRGLSMRLSKLTVSGEEEMDLAEGEMVGI